MIGGNINAAIQNKTTVKNEIGERIPTWTTIQSIVGFLDYTGGQSNYQNYDAKIQESTHIFICDYVPLDSRIKATKSRMLIKDKPYDILLIDNPMELNQQYEIYLKYVGD